MTRSPSPSRPCRSRLARFGRPLGAAGVFAAGLLASGVFSSATPAAPQDCLPVVGCVTTPAPPVTLPTVPLPTLPTSTTTAAPDTTPTTTTAAGETRSTESGPEVALAAKASVRVRGRGARRVVDIRLILTKDARVSALLSRSGSALARRSFGARAGSSILRLRVGRGPKSGPARLALTFSSDSGETVRASYRLRLPR